jgi:hypothetical protein
VQALAHSDNDDITGKWSVDKRLLYDQDGGHGMIFVTREGNLCLTLHSPQPAQKGTSRLYPHPVSGRGPCHRPRKGRCHVRAIRLKTKDLFSPLRLGTKTPHFSWNCEGGRVQTAYQIICIRAEAAPREVLWDSGVIRSSSMSHIAYEETPSTAGTL